MKDIEDKNKNLPNDSEDSATGDHNSVNESKPSTTDLRDVNDLKEEALQQSMKPLESRTAIPSKDTAHVDIESDPADRGNKTNGDGFINITNDAGEIE
jgi:hypothetical protein